MRFLRTVLILMAFWLLAACAPAPPEPIATSIPSATTVIPTTTPSLPTATATPALPGEEVAFSADDGVSLRGRVFGEGSTWVILVHMLGSEQQAWWGFAQLAAEEEVTVLTIDMRGHGRSGGNQDDWGGFVRDIQAAIGWAEAHSAQRVLLVGASMGGAAAIQSAIHPLVDGLVAVSAPSVEPLQWDGEHLMALTMPKLYIASEDDGEGYYQQIAEFFEFWAAEPKQVELFSGIAHGTELFDSDHSAAFTDLLLAFINEHK